MLHVKTVVIITIVIQLTIAKKTVEAVADNVSSLCSIDLR